MPERKMFASGVAAGDILIDELSSLEVTVGRTEQTAVTPTRHSVRLFDTAGRLIHTYDSTEYVTVRRAPVPATS